MLLSVDDRQSFLELLRRPNLSSLARKIIHKKINDKCKKVSKCPRCEGVNGEPLNKSHRCSKMYVFCSGIVKKCGLLKIIHIKYKVTTSVRQRPPLAVREFRETMATVSEDNKELAAHIDKAQEMLNPLRVLYLFRSISAEVEIVTLTHPHTPSHTLTHYTPSHITHPHTSHTSTFSSSSNLPHHQTK